MILSDSWWAIASLMLMMSLLFGESVSGGVSASIFVSFRHYQNYANMEEAPRKGAKYSCRQSEHFASQPTDLFNFHVWSINIDMPNTFYIKCGIVYSSPIFYVCHFHSWVCVQLCWVVCKYGIYACVFRPIVDATAAVAAVVFQMRYKTTTKKNSRTHENMCRMSVLSTVIVHLAANLRISLLM